MIGAHRAARSRPLAPRAASQERLAWRAALQGGGPPWFGCACPGAGLWAACASTQPQVSLDCQAAGCRGGWTPLIRPVGGPKHGQAWPPGVRISPGPACSLGARSASPCRVTGLAQPAAAQPGRQAGCGRAAAAAPSLIAGREAMAWQFEARGGRIFETHTPPLPAHLHPL